MTVSLEKLFFKYILTNTSYLWLVDPSFFKNPEINFIYDTIYQFMVENLNADVPKPNQIWDMISIRDKDKKISKKTLKVLLQTPINDYDEENFIKPKIKAWILNENIKQASSEVIDFTRELDTTELDLYKTEELADKIKNVISSKTNTNFEGDSSLGSDFTEADSHNQDQNTTKINTGWPSLDSMLGGGFDIDTLNIFMGQTNVGKSLWLQNIASNAANLGYNVVYFTLEMSEKKVMKRLGSMRLKIPINEYDEKSKNVDYIKRKIDSLKNGDNLKGDPAGLFNNKLGEINVKFYSAGSATINTLETHLNNLEKKRGFKPDLIIVDYLTLMAPVKGLGIESNLYLKGKHLAEGLRSIGSVRNCPAITALQVSKDAWNASDITLDKVPESKAIAETSDVFTTIIRTPEMKKNNKYIIKFLKQRDGDFSVDKCQFDLNPKFLSIENDKIIEEEA